MNTHTFGNHSVTCPICQRSGKLKQKELSNGLFTCPNCQERLVVSWSGNYVRDPHHYKQINTTLPHLLRRESRPLVRMLRDFSFLKRTAAIAAIGSAILLGVGIVTIDQLTPDAKTPQSSEQVIPPQD